MFHKHMSSLTRVYTCNVDHIHNIGSGVTHVNQHNLRNREGLTVDCKVF